MRLIRVAVLVTFVLVLSAPFVADAQPSAKIPRIGLLSSFAPSDTAEAQVKIERALIVLLVLGMLVAPLAVEAQPAEEVPQIGVLVSDSPEGSYMYAVGEGLIQ